MHNTSSIICSAYNTVNLTLREDTASEFLYNIYDEIFIKVILPMMLIAGLVGNGAFLFVVYRVERMRTATNFYLCNVAVSDLIFLVTGCGLYFTSYLYSPIRHDIMFTSSIGCSVWFVTIYSCYFLSINIYTLVTLERYYAICRPLAHRIVNSKERKVKLLFYAWIVSAILAGFTSTRYGKLYRKCVLWPMVDKYDHMPGVFHYCDAVNEILLITSEILFTVPLVSSFLANICMYCSIIRVLAKRNVAETSQKDSSVKQVSSQVARMLIAKGIIFFLCQGLHRFLSVTNLIEVNSGISVLSEQVEAQLLILSRNLLLLNSILNPYICLLFSPMYRGAFKEGFGHGHRKYQMNKPNKKNTNDSIQPISR